MRNGWKRLRSGSLRYVVYPLAAFVRGHAGRRTRLHHVYFLLAAFDLATVGGGLYLSHKLMTLYVQSVNVNQEWSVRLKDYSKLADLAQVANAPGNDIFDSGDVEKERSRRDAGLKEFTAHIRKLRQGLPHGNSELGSALDRVETAMVEMMAEADLIFRYFDSGEPAKAGERMATMDRKYGVLTREVNKCTEIIQGIQGNYFAAQLGEARELRRFEYVIGSLILLMVSFVVIYGHKIGRLFQRQYEELSSFNSKLTERGRELEAADERVTGLNAELASTIVKLEEAQAEMVHKEELRIQNLRFDAALHNMPAGLSMFDSEQRLIVCNRAYREIYDVPEELTRPGTPMSEIVRYHVRRETGRDGPDEFELQRKWIDAHVAELARGRLLTHTQNLRDGRIILVRNAPMAEGGWVDVHEDITEQSQHEAKIAHMARHDALTDLPNRAFLRERVEQALKGARRGEHVAMLCLDLDHFKEVNDTLGHPVGDALLRTVAERLAGCVRESDMVARAGGDEFVVLQVSAEPSKEAAALASRLIEVISAPYDLAGHEVLVGTSIGIAISPDDGTDCTTLMKNADLALYRSKGDGRGTYCFFEQEMNARMQARRDLEQDLRSSLANGELEINYQPIINLARNGVSGCEALLRWRHPQRGMVMPGEFIPLAEETGLIVPIGEWVLRQACAEAATWPDHVSVSVNLSPIQCKSRTLFQMVFNAVAAAGIAARRLELEITESALLQDSEATLANLRQLHEFGVRIAMDDFGTGYSSLGYLRKFPFDKIKIDRCFVKDLSTGGAGALAIVRAISRLGSALGLTITAEGVETQEQLETIRDEGCTEMQGYLISAARPAAEIRRLFMPRAQAPASAANTAAAESQRPLGSGETAQRRNISK